MQQDAEGAGSVWTTLGPEGAEARAAYLEQVLADNAALAEGQQQAVEGATDQLDDMFRD